MPTTKQKAVFFYISPICILVDVFAIVAVAKIDMMSMKRSEAIAKLHGADRRYARRGG